MKTTGIAAAALLASVVLAGAAGGEVKIEPVEYKGWRNAYRLTNGDAELVVVPEIARIMHYSLAGGENVLWEYDPAAGKPVDPENYRNFGGDKAWIWPQAEWHEKWGIWPPPAQSDQAAHLAVVSSPPMLSVTSPPLAGYGVTIVRGIKLADHGSGVSIITAVKPHGEGTDRAWGAWSVTQVRRPDAVYARLVPGSRLGKTHRNMNDTEWDGIRGMGGNVLKLPPPADKPAKVGMDADVLAWVRGDTIFTQKVDTRSGVLAGMQPGDLAQVFSSPGKAEETPFVELEFTSSRARMRGKGLTTLEVAWELAKLPARNPGMAVIGIVRAK